MAGNEVWKVLVLIIWMLIIPVFIGNIAAVGIGKYKKNLVFMWVMGQIILWALFQLICVPFILIHARLSRVTAVYIILTVILLLFSAGLWVRFRHAQSAAYILPDAWKDRTYWHHVLWGIFFLLLAFQMVQAARLAFTDGDDAYYVATATLAEESDTLYLISPYTGGFTGMDVRHGLAPFPIWIAFLARISGIHAASVAHIAVPLMLIPMAYGVFYLIGSRLCGKYGERLPFFLVIAELLVLFGNYSTYSAERFLIFRSRQGKATLGSIIVPVLFFLLLSILERMQEQKKVEKTLWILLTAAVMAGCLCSTQGAELSCLLLGVAGLCSSVCYRQWKLLPPMFLCCLPAVVYAVLYFVLH